MYIKIVIMRVISSAELRSNMKKYLDLAASEQIIIQRGKNETFRLTREEYLEPDEDFQRAMDVDEFKREAKAYIEKLYKK
jgi:hypothetical protein